MMHGLLIPLLSTAMLAAPAGTQSASRDNAPPSSREIVVEGREIRALVSEFVDRVLPTERGHQFGRFEDPICPRVVGLDEKASAEIADRIGAVGKAVRIEVKRERCAPNLVLVVVPDKRAALAQLRKSRPEYFALLSRSFVDTMTASNRPYASWQLSELFASDGMRIGRSDTRPGGGHLATDESGTFYDLNAARLKTTEPPSRLRANVRPQVQSAVVLVEARALDNVDTRQLADFALMQAMVPPNERNEDPPQSSILNVFATLPVPSDAPQSLTHTDVAFLKALRGVRSDGYSLVQKNAIRGQMISELERITSARN